MQSPARMLLAVLLVATWVASPLLSAVHNAIEQHEYCAEHGAFEHGSTAGVTPDHGRAHQHLEESQRGADAGHHLCTLGYAARNDGHQALAAIATPAPAQLSTELSAPPHMEVAEPIALLHRAPKSSPPLLFV